LIARGESLAMSMSQYLIEQIATKRNIRVETRSEVVAGHGGERLEAIEVVDRRTGTTSRRDTEALFILIGADAATGWLPVEVARAHGFILTGADAVKQGHWNGDRDPFAPETREVAPDSWTAG
jgi:thioredoxin reductase (NADPH)